MKRSLHRLLRIRALLESLSLLELQKKTGELRALEGAAEHERNRARAARSVALRGLTEGAEASAWLTEVADADLLTWRRGRLRKLAEGQRPQVDAAREDLLSRRRELRQVETLADAAAATEETERIRREQRLADDWYQSRRAREKK